MIIKECKMPDISDLAPSVIGAFLITSLAGSNVGKTKEEIACFSVIARLIDKAKVEYLTAREAVIKEVEERKMTYDEITKRDDGQYFFICEITNHLENCINALSRIYKLRKLLSPKYQFLANQKEEIVRTRNHIEHIDSRIFGSIPGSRSLSISEDALNVEIVNENLRLDDLANEIRLLHTDIRRALYEPKE